MALAVNQDAVARLLAVNTSNVSDALDRLGINGAASGVLPLWPGCGKIAGPVMTLKLVPKQEGLESAVLDTLRAVVAGGAGSILLIDNSGRDHINSFGGIVGATAKHNGVVGCVSDGAMRDVDEYKTLGLSCYARGITQRSIRNFSSSMGFGGEIAFAGLSARAGDYVLADDNGVVVIPQVKLEETIATAEAVKAVEDKVIADMRAGGDPVEAHLAVNYDSMLKRR